MSKTVKFEDLSKENQEIVKKAGKKLLFSSLLTGANYGGLMFMSNLILVMINHIYFESQILLLIACVLVDIKLLGMMGKSNAENAKAFADTVKKVLEQQ
jgi:hypothetical protein